MSIHPTAIIDPDAKIGQGNTIGPYCVIGPGVQMGDNNQLSSHVVLERNVVLGSNNFIASFACIGGCSQSVHDNPEDPTFVSIGNHNRFYEYCTINRGSLSDKKTTTVGHHNHFMACSHVAHDCVVEDHVVLVNHATLGGHAVVRAHAIIGAFVAVRQFCEIGSYAFMVEACQIVKDVLPYTVVQGSDCRVRGINKVGLRRHDFTDKQIQLINEAFRVIYRRGLVVKDALAQLEAMMAKDDGAVVAPIHAFLQNSSRGIVR